MGLRTSIGKGTIAHSKAANSKRKASTGDAKSANDNVSQEQCRSISIEY